MALGNRAYKWASWATGLANSNVGLKQLYKTRFGYTDTKKKVAAGSATAILGSTATATTPQTITSTTSITQPDVPRCLSVVVGGTASSVLDSAIVITGLNVEGKTITESFQTTAAGTGTINGSKAFFRVTSIFIPAQAGTAATVTVGTQNKLGVFHRLFPSNTTVKVVSYTTVGGFTGAAAPTIQGAPTVVANESVLELNTVQPATTPDGSTFLVIAYQYDRWSLGDLNDYPSYFTSTSTSTSSTSTSTTTTPTTSTSTSSTSTSSTSSSTSSTSTSTSSTSTSTTTTP